MHLKSEELDALPAPVEPTERPLPTSVLMQLSSQSENKPSAPSQSATPPLYYKTTSGPEDGACGRLGIYGFGQRHVLVIFLGLLALSVVAVAIVELAERWWKR